MEDLHGFKRPIENTKEAIFPSDNPKKKKIKVKRNTRLSRKKMFNNHYGDKIGGIMSPRHSSLERKLPSKPCNNNYNVVMDEAKKNAHVRYYFENNLSQFNIN